MKQSVNSLHPKTPYQQDTLDQVMELVQCLPLSPKTLEAIKEDLKYEPVNPLLLEIRKIGSKLNPELASTTPAPYIR